MEIEIIAQDFYDYSTYILGYSKSTIKRYRQAIRFYCKVANVQSLDQVNEENLRKLFYYGRSEKGWKTTTFLSCHKSLFVFFRWCKNKGFVEKNYVETIEQPKLEKVLPPKLTKQQAFFLLE